MTHTFCTSLFVLCFVCQFECRHIPFSNILFFTIDSCENEAGWTAKSVQAKAFVSNSDHRAATKSVQAKLITCKNWPQAAAKTVQAKVNQQKLPAIKTFFRNSSESTKSYLSLARTKKLHFLFLTDI